VRLKRKLMICSNCLPGKSVRDDTADSR
jgi:hypothetical protein